MLVKVCGITNEADALMAVAMGADAIGLVLAPSQRQVTPTMAGEIARRLPKGVLAIGVFRDEAPERVVEVVAKESLGGAQLHGHESLSEVRWVAERVPFLIKAFPAGSPELERAPEYPVQAVLVDALSPGSGEVFDWSLVEGPSYRQRLVLAGGLGPDNVEAAVRRVRPWGVDASSRLERAPGQKDPWLVREYVRRAKAALGWVWGEGEDEGEVAKGAPPYDWMEEL
jgi:phosphoribosylanthranilate isomerase